LIKRAHVYDKKVAILEETKKVLIDPTLEGKSREEMGLEPFVDTKIRTSIMGIPVFNFQDMIAYVIRRASEGSFKDGLDNNKKSPWKEVVHQTMFNNKKNSAYSNLSMEKKMLLKIQNENLIPKGGGSDKPSLEHRVFLHFFIKKDMANVPKYIFNHMIKTLRESQLNNRIWVPYGRLISEILHQGGILKALDETKVFTDQQLGTVTGRLSMEALWGTWPWLKRKTSRSWTQIWRSPKPYSISWKAFLQSASKTHLMCSCTTFTTICKALERISNWRIYQIRCMVVLCLYQSAGRQKGKHSQRMSILMMPLNNLQKCQEGQDRQSIWSNWFWSVNNSRGSSRSGTCQGSEQEDQKWEGSCTFTASTYSTLHS